MGFPRASLRRLGSFTSASQTLRPCQTHCLPTPHSLPHLHLPRSRFHLHRPLWRQKTSSQDSPFLTAEEVERASRGQYLPTSEKPEKINLQNPKARVATRESNPRPQLLDIISEDDTVYKGSGNKPHRHTPPKEGSYGDSFSPALFVRDSEVARRKEVLKLREEWSKYNRLPPESKAADFVEGNRVNIRGFLSKRRVQNAELVFANILVTNGPNIQVTSASSQSYSQALRSIRLHSPVAVTGTITRLDKEDFKAAKPDSPLSRFPSNVVNVELDLVTIKPLNVFPKDIILSRDVEFPASSRHLQIRFSNPLRSRLAARARIGLELRNSLDKVGFTEVETPILFKSTPEGAREFIVPTRSRNLAYALPQSPQQYKQILMSAGIRGYYQFARCFRDEDLRADRQPEFTQLDLEMSFATGQDVMDAVESLVTELPASLNAEFRLVESRGEIHPLPLRNSGNSQERRDAQSGLAWPSFAAPFPRLTYQEVMTRFGIDKPDLRIPFEIRRVDQILPAEFVSMITNLKDQPIVEAFRFRPETRNGNAVESSTTFVKKLINNLPLGIRCHNVPTPIVFNTSKPMCGLSSLGFEGFEALQSCAPGLEDFQDLENGDIIFFLARENKPFQGGSTALGMIRTAVYREAVSMGLLPRNLDFKFLWVVDFPMFMPNNDEDPGQGGSAGFSATHHPFTAPLTDKDVELLTTDPLKARGDHYDLVVNGVELGGGSRRIHLAVLQEYVMRDILRMTDTGVEQFSHLLEALRVGCPPHAGFALGFDRLVAVLTHTESVRDVIAFPKSMKGKDLMVNSPGEITEEQMRTYFPGWRPPTSS